MLTPSFTSLARKLSFLAVDAGIPTFEHPPSVRISECEFYRLSLSSISGTEGITPLNFFRYVCVASHTNHILALGVCPMSWLFWKVSQVTATVGCTPSPYLPRYLMQLRLRRWGFPWGPSAPFPLLTPPRCAAAGAVLQGIALRYISTDAKLP